MVVCDSCHKAPSVPTTKSSRRPSGPGTTAGDPANPDLVTFLGWEWTQIGRTPKDHYGHKNVILRDTEEDRVPRRPINAAAFAANAMRQGIPLRQRLFLPLLDFPNRQIDWNLM